MALTLSPISLTHQYPSNIPYSPHLRMSQPSSPDDPKISLPGISSLIEAANGAAEHRKRPTFWLCHETELTCIAIDRSPRDSRSQKMGAQTPTYGERPMTVSTMIILR